MGLLTDPHVFVEMYLVRYPASLGTLTLRATECKRPISRVGAFYQPRLKSISEITRACTDPDGNYEIGSVRLTFDDSDGYYSTLLEAGQNTEYWYAREIAVWVISYEGLLAGLTPATVPPVFRGWMSDVQRNERDVEVAASDVIGSQFSGFNLDKKVLTIAAKDLSNCPREESKDWKLPIFIGEFSDRGAMDANNAPADRGLVSVKEICEIDITNLATCPVPTFAPPPIITSSGVVGTTGEVTYYYAATLITPYGESTLSNIVALNGAASRSLSNYNWIEGTYDNGGASPYNEVRIWRSDDGVSWSYYLDRASYVPPGPNVFGYADGAAAYPFLTRDELDVPKFLTPPGISGAQTNLNIFSVMGICLGYSYDILDLYASDLANQAEPKRLKIDPSEHGVTTITSDDPQWPFPNPWIEMNGVIFTGFLQRGPKLNAHRDGSVTMAANICGPHDGSNNLINQAVYALQVLLNEHGLKNHGTGYRNQTYGTLETFTNGHACIQTSSFVAAQAMTVTWIGGLGYLGAIWITDPETTWRDVIKKVARSWGLRIATNRYGQVRVFFINTEPDSITGRHFRERIEIKHTEQSTLAYTEIVNQFVTSYFWDPEGNAFRGLKIVTPNATSIAAHVPGGVDGGVDKRGLREQERELDFVSDAATANDVVNRELIRRERRLRYPSITLPLLGLDYDLGDRCRLTDSHGLGALGDAATKIIILRHEIRLDSREVTLSFQDLSLATAGSSVGSVAGATAHAVGSSAAGTARRVG